MIERTRYIITRNNRQEIFCGLARNYKFKKIDEIGDTILKTYATKNKAISSFNNSWWGIDFEYEILPIKETIEICEENA